MFGYITVNRGELKVKELQVYNSWYCGLCTALRDKSGTAGRLTLSYDMTFLEILLSSLYDKPVTKYKMFCPVHPGVKHPVRRTCYSEYTAGMNVLMSYYDRMDDWKDEKKPGSYLEAKAIEKTARKASQDYPRQGRALEEYISALTQCEKDNDPSIEKAASLTGKMLAEIFVPEEDIWSADLRTMGFFLGKFIYLSDAYCDIEKDIRTSAYNPLRSIFEREDFDDTCKDMLMMQMSECCRAFERLPIVRYAGILRNILYSGVWARFAAAYRKRNNLQP